jgi:hypothetical protein
MHASLGGTHQCHCMPNLHVLGPAVHQVLTTSRHDLAHQLHPWLESIPSSSPICYFSFMCLMWAAHGPTLVSWSFGTCLLASPSPPPVHHAWASHLTFSIACRLPRRTEHLHIHKPSDMLQNISKITKHNTTPLDSHYRKSLKPLNSYLNHSYDTWMRPRHFSTWSIKNSPLMNAMNNT